jgi:hypothetical protein
MIDVLATASDVCNRRRGLAFSIYEFLTAIADEHPAHVLIASIAILTSCQNRRYHSFPESVFFKFPCFDESSPSAALYNPQVRRKTRIASTSHQRGKLCAQYKPAGTLALSAVEVNSRAPKYDSI